MEPKLELENLIKELENMDETFLRLTKTLKHEGAKTFLYNAWSVLSDCVEDLKEAKRRLDE